jgi:hypothetical protein
MHFIRRLWNLSVSANTRVISASRSNGDRLDDGHTRIRRLQAFVVAETLNAGPPQL